MNRRHFLYAACSTVAAFVMTGCAGNRAEPGDDAPRTLRVMTYNIHHAAGADGRVDVERIARIIASTAPDVVAIQEVDVRTKRVDMDEAEELGRLTGMHAVFGKAIDFMGGDYGQAILSRYPLSDVTVHPLPSKPNKEQRIALAATVHPGQGRSDFTFVSVHLDHASAADRTEQVEQILRIFPCDRVSPLLIAGDLNAGPGAPELRPLMERFDNTLSVRRPTAGPRVAGSHGGDKASAPTSQGAHSKGTHTHPADAPNRQIDFILVPADGPWVTSDSRVIDEPVASDHRPVWAELHWK